MKGYTKSTVRIPDGMMAIEKNLKNKRRNRRLSPEELRILMYSVIMRHASRDYSHRFSVREIARSLGMDPGQVSRKIKELSYEMLWIKKVKDDLSVGPGHWQVFGRPNQMAEAVPELRAEMLELERSWWIRNEPRGFKRWYWLRFEHEMENHGTVAVCIPTIEITIRGPDASELYRELEKRKKNSLRKTKFQILMDALNGISSDSSNYYRQDIDFPSKKSHRMKLVTLKSG